MPPAGESHYFNDWQHNHRLDRIDSPDVNNITKRGNFTTVWLDMYVSTAVLCFSELLLCIHGNVEHVGGRDYSVTKKISPLCLSLR